MVKTVEQITSDYNFQDLALTVLDIVDLINATALRQNFAYTEIYLTISKICTAIGQPYLINGQPFFLTKEHAVYEILRFLKENVGFQYEDGQSIQFEDGQNVEPG